jgi:hypothetical protein
LDFGWAAGEKQLGQPVSVVAGDKIAVMVFAAHNPNLAASQDLVSVKLGSLSLARAAATNQAARRVYLYWIDVPSTVGTQPVSMPILLAPSGSTQYLGVKVFKITGAAAGAPLGTDIRFDSAKAIQNQDPIPVDLGQTVPQNAVGLVGVLAESAPSGITFSGAAPVGTTLADGPNGNYKAAAGVQNAATVSIAGQPSGGPSWQNIVILNAVWRGGP